MRSSTGIVAVLFGIAALWLLGTIFLPPVVDPLAEYIGKQKSGKAIIPPYLDEQEIREKPRYSDGGVR